MQPLPRKEYILYIPDYNKYVSGINDKYVLMKSNKDEALHFSTKSKAIEFIKNNKLKTEDYRIVSLNNSFYLIVNLLLFTTCSVLSMVDGSISLYFCSKVLYTALIILAIVFNCKYNE